MGTPVSARIIKDVDLALKLLEILYRANGAAVEGLADRFGHIQKVVGEGEIISLGGAQIKGKGGASANSPKICSCTLIC